MTSVGRPGVRTMALSSGQTAGAILENGDVLYVGKAKRLRSRVRSYWVQDHSSSPKTRGLLRKTRSR